MRYVFYFSTALYRCFRLSRVPQAIDPERSIDWCQNIFNACPVAQYNIVLWAFIENLSNIYWTSVENKNINGNSIEVMSKGYRASIEIPLNIHRNSVEHPPKFYRTLIGNLLTIYRNCIQTLSLFIFFLCVIYRKSTENLLNTYRTSVEHLSNTDRTSIENLSITCRKSVEDSQNP